MRLVYLNAWGGREWPALSAWLPTLGADVLCLQEVIRAPHGAPDWLHYTDPNRALAQRGDLFADVSTLLPRYQARFAMAARGVLQDAEGRDHPSEHGLGQWCAASLAVLGHWHGLVFGAPRMGGWGPEPVPRAAQISRVVGGNGSPVVVAQIHGLRHPRGKGDVPERREQWDRLVAALTAFREPDEPLVVGGDLNVLPGSEVFDILGGLGLTDLVTSRGITDTRTALYEKPQRHANYLFVSRQVTVQDFQVPAVPVVSDHRPMILDLAVS